MPVAKDSLGTTFSTIVDATAIVGVKVKIDATLNFATRLLTVIYTSLDPATNDVPLDALAGFLPPNVNDPEGDGYLTYTVAPKTSTANGTRIDAKATIVFDTEAPLDTPAVHNTVDTAPPKSKVTALPANSPANYTVSRTGSDPNGSGVATYDIYLSDNNGAYTLMLDDTAQTSAAFTGVVGHTYRFYSVATDNVGFTESKAAIAEATTTITSGGGQTGSISGVLWDDADADGVFDANEKATGVRTVFLDTNANSKLDSGEKSVQSDTGGLYTFANLAAGTYNVSRVFPTGYRFSNSPVPYLTTTVTAGVPTINVNIGTTNKSGPTPPTGTASIAGTLFNDDDNDGVFDAKEKTTGARTVFLDTNANGKLDSGEKSVQSDSAGKYKFGNLSAGTYNVTRVFPSGYRLSGTAAKYFAITVAANEQKAGVNLGTTDKK